MTVTCDGFGLDGAEIAHVAAAIAFGVATVLCLFSGTGPLVQLVQNY